MPQATGAGLRLGVINPADAVRAFQERKALLPSFRWQDVWAHEHQRGLAVAGVMRADVLQVVQDAIDAKFAEGTTLAEFAKTVRPQLAAKGFWGDVEVADPATGETRVTRFDDSRLKLIYELNVRQSYAAGKWDRYQAVKKQFPFVMYRTMGDDRVRPLHAAWNNLVLPIDDPWVLSHWCPCGWRCRCIWIQQNQRGLDRLQAAGQKLQFTAPPEDYVPYVNPYTGEVKAVPRGVDPGFGADPRRNAGRDEALAEAVLQKAVRSPAYPGAVVAAQAATDMPALAVRRADQFAVWLKTHRELDKPGAAVFPVGTIQPQVVRALEAAGIELKTSVIAVRGVDVAHALRSGKSGGVEREALPIELYAQLPMLLQRPSAVLQVLNSPADMVYVVDIADRSGALVKLYVLLGRVVPQEVDGQPVRKALNLVRTASLQIPQALRDPGEFRLLWGQWSPS